MKELEKVGKPARLLGRSFDLKSAYRQLALSDGLPQVGPPCGILRRRSGHLFPAVQYFLPLAKAGGLLEVRTNDQWIAHVVEIVTSCYFDDYVCLTPARSPWLRAHTKLFQPCWIFWAGGMIAAERSESMSSEVSAVGVVSSWRHAWQELLWKKPPLRTSTCGRHRFRRNHPLWEPRMWQGQVWEARPDGESTRGKAKFGRGMEAASGKKRTPQHEGVTEGRAGNGRKPPPPIQCATHPIGHPQGGLLSNTLYFSNAGNASAAIFGGFWHPQWVLRKGFSRIRRGIRRHPRVRWQICESKWLVFRTLPCDVAV